MTFSDLNLSSSLLNALSEQGITTPTVIQERAFSPIMSGRDLVGIAQTGTGKTLAYLLPCLRQWTFNKDKTPQILIIVPTRELVAQIVGEVEKLTTNMNVTTVGVYGGANIKTQSTQVYKGCDHEKEIIVKVPKKEDNSAAFHEKLEKNLKPRIKVTRPQAMRLKYGKPKTRGQKRK